MKTPDSPAPVSLPRSNTMMRFWRRLLGNDAEITVAETTTAISAKEWKAIQKNLQACALQTDSETVIRNHIRQLLEFYTHANEADKLKFFQMLEQDYQTNAKLVTQSIRQYLEAKQTEQRVEAEAALSLSLESPRLHILRQFNLVPHGIEALVNMRADTIRLAPKQEKSTPWPALERDLLRLFTLWFDAGFLELSRIGWNSPASLLEKVIRYEAVHEIKSWNDLRNRLDSDRRCYAFFHGRMPEEPLIFVEVALVENISANVQALLDESAPTHNPASATTAIFYSISNAQQGLRGVSMGEFLIKRVVEQLKQEFHNLETFATLSPVPGFNRWLQTQFSDAGYVEKLPKNIQKLLENEQKQQDFSKLKKLLQKPDQISSTQWSALQDWLQAECAWYLLREKRKQHPLDAVARFHFANGAGLHRINWQADSSENGIKQSSSIMVNYLYKLDEIDGNQQAYAQDGQLSFSADVKKLLQAAQQRRK